MLYPCNPGRCRSIIKTATTRIKAFGGNLLLQNVVIIQIYRCINIDRVKVTLNIAEITIQESDTFYPFPCENEPKVALGLKVNVNISLHVFNN